MKKPYKHPLIAPQNNKSWLDVVIKVFKEVMSSNQEKPKK
jgi:hypothetical protein